jgi:hypothetical protein
MDVNLTVFSFCLPFDLLITANDFEKQSNIKNAKGVIAILILANAQHLL